MFQVKLLILSTLLVNALGSPLAGPPESTQGKIIGGHEVSIEEFPFIASLFRFANFQCGAVIISDRFVLTAGHCVSA